MNNSHDSTTNFALKKSVMLVGTLVNVMEQVEDGLEIAVTVVSIGL